MNVEAVRRVTITLSKAEIIGLLKARHAEDIHVQSMGLGGSPVEMTTGNDGVTLRWFSGPLSQRELSAG